MLARDVVRLLPEVLGRAYSKGTPFAALVDTMVFLLEPAERRLTGLDAYFDAYRAPDSMVPYLAGWLDLAWLPVRAEIGGEGLPMDRVRALVSEAPRLAASRGTSRGLQRFLEVALDEPLVEVIDAEQARPFHVIVALPERAASQRRLAEIIVQSEKPVHLTHEIRIT